MLAEWDDLFSSYRFYSGIEYIKIEDIDIELEKYGSCLDYHRTMKLASEEDGRASAHQSKLDKLLRIQSEYF